MVGRKGVTKLGFGGLLKAGIPATVIVQKGDNIIILLQDDKTIFHGKITDFIFDDFDDKEKEEGESAK